MSDEKSSAVRDVDAGRELDAMVAERVMGLRVVSRAPYWSYQHPTLLIQLGIPRYSEDMDSAWLVVEHMIAKEVGEFRLIHRQTFGPGPQFLAGFHPSPCAEPSPWWLGETGPLAICRAALATAPSPTAASV